MSTSGSEGPTSSRGKLVAIVSVLVVIALIVIGLFAFGGGNDDDDTPSSQTPSSQKDDEKDDGDQPDDELVHDRPEYDRKNLGPAVADPGKLTFTPDDRLVTTSDVIEACNVFTLEDVTEHGLLIEPKADGLSRTYIDKDSYTTPSTNIPLREKSSSCHYLIHTAGKSDVDSITVQVIQPFIMSNSDLQQRIDKNFKKSDPVDGVDLYVKEDAELGNKYLLKKGEVSVQAEIDLKNTEGGDEKVRPILSTIAKNLASQQDELNGPGKFGLDSPIYTKDIVRACDVLTSEDASTVNNGDNPSIFVVETLDSAIGRLTGETAGGETYEDNIVTTTCARTTVSEGPTLPPALNLRIQSHETEESSAGFLNFQKEGADNAESVDGIGDEAYTIDAHGMHSLNFRKGRIYYTLRLGELGEDPETLQDLIPVAKKVVERTKAE